MGVPRLSNPGLGRPVETCVRRVLCLPLSRLAECLQSRRSNPCEPPGLQARARFWVEITEPEWLKLLKPAAPGGVGSEHTVNTQPLLLKHEPVSRRGSALLLFSHGLESLLIPMQETMRMFIRDNVGTRTPLQPLSSSGRPDGRMYLL